MRLSRLARKQRGQFYTPPEVARAMVRLCQSWNRGRLPDGVIVDPAGGEGVFLKAAHAAGIAGERLWGVDLDPAMRAAWRAGGLIKAGARLRIADGLRFRGPTGGAGLVIGNPPFGFSLDGQPIEAHFARRFIDLARPGGLVAVILPEGLLANARARRLRQDLAQHAEILAIIGLPADVFRREGANVRTAILIARRRTSTSAGESAAQDVLVASPDFPGAPDSLAAYLAAVCQAADPSTDGPGTGPWILAPGPGWPDQRWDPGYWHPRLQAPLAEMRYPSRPLGAFIDAITYGPIVTRKNAQPEALNYPRGIPVIGQKQLLDLGLNLAGSERVRPGSIYDPARARVRRGDLLIPRSGAGSLGRNRLAVYEGSGPATVSCFVDRLRLKGIRPRYVAAFLKSKPGRLQLQRAANGAGTVNVNFAELRAIEIPLAPVDVQRRLARLVSRTQKNGTDAGEVIRETERLLSRTA